VTDTYEYDAFGNRVSSTGTTPNNYLYRGEQYDPDLGLYYLRARYYNPVTDRFLNVDPMAGAGQRRYEYAAADPVDGADPSGNFVLASYWPLMAPLQVRPSIPSWCNYIPSFFGVPDQCQAPPPPPQPPPPCTGPQCKKYVAVADGNPPTGTINGTTGRFVNYYIHDLYCDGGHWSYSQQPVTSYWVDLKETLIKGSHKGTSICDHPTCSQDGIFEDWQAVNDGTAYSITREWGMNKVKGPFGSQIPVWDPNTSKPANYETLHLQFNSKFFNMEYADQ
jgi:RHS repeat-associated protein